MYIKRAEYMSYKKRAIHLLLEYSSAKQRNTDRSEWQDKTRQTKKHKEANLICTTASSMKVLPLIDLVR
jgi:hypothetical protein